MAHAIVQYTNVKFKGHQYICKTFPEIWDLLKANALDISEDDKGYLLRYLFVNGKAEVDFGGTVVEFEIG